MTRRQTSIRRAALTAVALLWAGTGCNSIGEKPELAEAVVLVTDVSVSPLSQASTGDTIATLSLLIADRTGQASSFFNDVTFTNYRVIFIPTGLVPDVPSGVINSGFSSVGDTATLKLPLTTQASRLAAPTGVVITGIIQVEGHDVRGHALSFEHPASFVFTP